jgi:hypothetical protein
LKADYAVICAHRSPLCKNCNARLALPIRPDSRRPQHTIKTAVLDYIVSGAIQVKGHFVAVAFYQRIRLLSCCHLL